MSKRVCYIATPEGEVPYSDAREWMRTSVSELKKTETPFGMLALLEHKPVITLGRVADKNNILIDDEALSKHNITLEETDRGGDVTYHGPGQLMGYPVFRLNENGRSVVGFLRMLEDAIIQTVKHFGVSATLKEGLTGVWVNDKKIAAIGISVSRWMSFHGFALNVNVDLNAFSHIVPCGISDYSTTSLAQELGKEQNMREVQNVMKEKLATVFSITDYKEVKWKTQN